jgi:hypothetical protein
MPGLQDPFSGNPQRAWQRRANPVAPAIADGINKSRLAHPEPRRSRDKEHVRFVGAKPCLICGRRPADAHHLRFAQTHRNLSAKNCLIPADPQQVENAFQSKLAKLTTATENDGPLPSIPSSQQQIPQQNPFAMVSTRVDWHIQWPAVYVTSFTSNSSPNSPV